MSRMRRLFVITSACAFVVLVVVGVLIAGSNIRGASASAFPSPQTMYSRSPHIIDTGNVSTGDFGIPRTRTGTPAFTVSDVRNYINTHPFPGGPTLSGKPLTITSIEFITSAVASARLNGEDIGVPPGQLVCYVQLTGEYNPLDVSVPPGFHLDTEDTATEIFDATTGNLLLLSVPASALQKD